MSTQVTDSVLQAERRARSYWDIDGLPIIAQAVAVLLAGLWFLYMNYSGAWGRHQSELASLVCIVAVVLDMIRKPGAIAWLKAKITYPRTGYVARLEQKVQPEGRGVNFAALGFVCLLIGFWAVALSVETPWICVAAGIVTGLALWWNPVREKFAYLDILGIACVGMLAAVLLNATHSVFHLQRFAFTLTALGTLGLIKGIVTLLRYVQRNPVQS